MTLSFVEALLTPFPFARRLSFYRGQGCNDFAFSVSNIETGEYVDKCDWMNKVAGGVIAHGVKLECSKDEGQVRASCEVLVEVTLLCDLMAYANTPTGGRGRGRKCAQDGLSSRSVVPDCLTAWLSAEVGSKATRSGPDRKSRDEHSTGWKRSEDQCMVHS